MKGFLAITGMLTMLLGAIVLIVPISRFSFNSDAEFQKTLCGLLIYISGQLFWVIRREN